MEDIVDMDNWHSFRSPSFSMTSTELPLSRNGGQRHFKRKRGCCLILSSGEKITVGIEITKRYLQQITTMNNSIDVKMKKR